MSTSSGPRRRPTGPHPTRPGHAGAGIPQPRAEAGSAEVGAVPNVPAPRTAADVYRVSEDQVHRARIAVARNSLDSDDCRELLDMLGLLGESGEPPPVRR